MVSTLACFEATEEVKEEVLGSSIAEILMRWGEGLEKKHVEVCIIHAFPGSVQDGGFNILSAHAMQEISLHRLKTILLPKVMKPISPEMIPFCPEPEEPIKVTEAQVENLALHCA